MARLLVDPWTGNIRQLKHVVERAVILARGQVIEPGDLPREFQETDESRKGDSGSLRRVRKRVEAEAAADVERTMVLECLERAEWNVQEAARLAQYSRAQFYRLMSKHGITRPK